MTQEDKELLLKDLCARLPYDVYADIVWEDGIVRNEAFINTGVIRDLICDDIKSIKPYLRLMSSMTNEERQEYYKLHDNLKYAEGSFYTPDIFDWLTSRHFDYRGLIKKGLALEAPEGMYEICT